MPESNPYVDFISASASYASYGSHVYACNHSPFGKYILCVIKDNSPSINHLEVVIVPAASSVGAVPRDSRLVVNYCTVLL